MRSKLNTGTFRKNKITTVYTCHDSQRKGVVTSEYFVDSIRFVTVQYPDGETENIPIAPRSHKSRTAGGARTGAGRKLGPKGKKKPYAVTLYDCDIEKIRKKYGSLQKWIEKLIIYV